MGSLPVKGLQRLAKPKSSQTARPAFSPSAESVDNAEPATEQVLSGILNSAVEVLGGSGGFVLVCQPAGVLEVVSVCGMQPLEALQLTLGAEAAPLRQVLFNTSGPSPGCALQGAVPTALGSHLFGAELDLGASQRGLMCVLRGADPDSVGELDLEIVQALCDQAAVVIGVQRAGLALAELKASLSGSNWPTGRQ